MNGPDSPTCAEIDEDSDVESRVADYTIGTRLVYGAFAWSQEAQVRSLFTALASKHGVAVALVSDGGEILRPSAPGADKSAKPARKRFWGR
ncbi:hypothetical protein KKR91_08010 [Arthrobacter jiangjiafuii]|uniref:Uncharacterized protein n=1 Tax=Arthrobacter jiangjiafuii TaxID=2817475 RepID=A0A975M7N3_9MICC|nr:hypothetical protein [Arthrobacter jiangjiafuii]MBP3042947.1 hypothetical protein [Arthrobacter jiangjiafuii]QWC11476.1 hypothetical protein KKR91_08010 [Arthrobacter jiangjiafuii]